MHGILVLCVGGLILGSSVIATSKNDSSQNELLIASVKRGDEDQVVSLIKRGANVNEKEDVSGLSALHISSGAGFENITEILIDNGANFDIRSNEGWTPLRIAAVNGQVKTAKLLINAGANVDSTDNSGIPILQNIISATSRSGEKPYNNSLLNGTEVDGLSQEKAFELLIQNGADVNKFLNVSRKYPNMNPLHWALMIGRERLAEILIENGADTNAIYWDYFGRGYTPVYCAYMCYKCENRFKLLELLVEHGANLSVVSLDEYGHSPLAYAVISEKDEKIIDFLIEKGAPVNRALTTGTTPLHIAVGKGSVRVVGSLIRAGAHVNAEDEDLETPLHELKKMKNWFADDFYAVCELLIDNGANVTAENADGKTAFDLVTDEKIRKLLKEKMDESNLLGPQIE